MTLMEHLFELRNRLGIAAIALFLGAVVGFVWFGTRIFGLPSLGDLLTGPYCGLPSSARLSQGGDCQLLQTGPFDQFSIRLQVGVAVGAVLSAPVWLAQIWGFITPGLHRGERRFAVTFVGVASVLFAAGALLAYLMVPVALRFLTSIGDGQFLTALSGDRYVSFLLILLLVFGVSFELPLLVVMLNRAGVLSYEQIARWRRGIIFGLFVFAAVMTPGQDPFSMIALAGALVVLFELAAQIARLHDRKQLRLAAERGELDPDEASNLDHDVEPVESARPVDYDEAT